MRSAMRLVAACYFVVNLLILLELALSFASRRRGIVIVVVAGYLLYNVGVMATTLRVLQ